MKFKLNVHQMTKKRISTPQGKKRKAKEVEEDEDKEDTEEDQEGWEDPSSANKSNCPVREPRSYLWLVLIIVFSLKRRHVPDQTWWGPKRGVRWLSRRRRG